MSEKSSSTWQQPSLIGEPEPGLAPISGQPEERRERVQALIAELKSEAIRGAPFTRVQRWSVRQRSEYLESVVLGFPLTPIFMLDDNLGRRIVVDGWQRLSALKDFVDDRFALTDLVANPELNGRALNALSPVIRHRLLDAMVPVVVVRSSYPRELATEIFRRLNATAVPLSDAEFRTVALDGPFYRFAQECSEDDRFRRLVENKKKRNEHGEALELTLRFFAFSDRYRDFVHEVARFIHEYVSDLNRSFFPVDEMKDEFIKTMAYVDTVFPYGFQRSRFDDRVPRVRFEALAVGVNLARRSGRLDPAPDLTWLETEEFANFTRTEASNSQKRLAGRIEFVRDRLTLPT